MTDYDIIIIGSGPAGYTAAIEASDKKLSVALIEKHPDRIGGVCLNEGCIPLKGYLHYSKNISDCNEIRNTVTKKLSTLRKGLLSRLESPGIDIIYGTARFTSNTEISINEQKLKANNFIIATGSSPLQIFKNKSVHQSEKLFELSSNPGKVLIIGGGVIGCEYASFFSNLGSAVTIVEVLDSILFNEDKETVRTLVREFKKKKILIYSGSSLITISDTNDVLIQKGDTEINEKYDLIIEATGRKPNTESLGIEEAGIELLDNRFIRVNSNYQTSKKNIYAIGDCIDTPMLAFTAYREAECVIQHIAEKPVALPDYSILPNLVFSMPQVGSIGINEDMAREKQISFIKYKCFFKTIGKAVVEGKDTGFLKLITYNNLLIGASAIGDDIADIINELSVIISNRIPIDDILNSWHIHPSYSEIILEALRYGKESP